MKKTALLITSFFLCFSGFAQGRKVFAQKYEEEVRLGTHYDDQVLELLIEGVREGEIQSYSLDSKEAVPEKLTVNEFELRLENINKERNQEVKKHNQEIEDYGLNDRHLEIFNIFEDFDQANLELMSFKSDEEPKSYFLGWDIEDNFGVELAFLVDFQNAIDYLNTSKVLFFSKDEHLHIFNDIYGPYYWDPISYAWFAKNTKNRLASFDSTGYFQLMVKLNAGKPETLFLTQSYIIDTILIEKITPEDFQSMFSRLGDALLDVSIPLDSNIKSLEFNDEQAVIKRINSVEHLRFQPRVTNDLSGKEVYNFMELKKLSESMYEGILSMKIPMCGFHNWARDQSMFENQMTLIEIKEQLKLEEESGYDESKLTPEEKFYNSDVLLEYYIGYQTMYDRSGKLLKTEPVSITPIIPADKYIDGLPKHIGTIKWEDFYENLSKELKKSKTVQDIKNGNLIVSQKIMSVTSF